jgi:O-antigen/teichoic acid export membrane protein
MTDTAQNNKRIAKNTILLYIRMLFIMIISLFTSRINLQSLGAEDFGIYNVVGGVVAMFSVFSGSLATAISRFITFELGKNDKERLNKVFSTAVSIQIVLAVFIIIIAEIAGVWFLNNKMIIPENRLHAANWVLQLSILSFAVSLISVPYNAAIIAHEKMSAFAYISIFEVVMKLIICYSLFVSPVDKLITFAVLLFILSISLRLIYGIYCKKHFTECQYNLILDKKLFKDIAGFAGWSSFTLVAYSLYNSGLNILLNLFFGPVVNAARGIAVQVQNAVQGFSKNFQTAINPQIIKSYAEGDLKRVYELIYIGSKFSFFLMYIIALPIIIEINFILGIWLENVPVHTNNFVRLILIMIIIDSIGGPLYCAQQATGKIKKFQIITGTLMMSILPVSYICLKLGTNPESVYVVYIIILFIVQYISVLLINNIIQMPLKIYFHEVVLKIIYVVSSSIILPLFAYVYLPNNISSFIIICILSFLSVLISIYLLGLSTKERIFLKSKITAIYKNNF